MYLLIDGKKFLKIVPSLFLSLPEYVRSVYVLLNAFLSFTSSREARPQGNHDETYGRAKLRRDSTTAKVAGSGRASVVQNTHTLTYQKKPGNVATVPSLSVLRMKENSETLQPYAESFVPDSCNK